MAVTQRKIIDSSNGNNFMTLKHFDVIKQQKHRILNPGNPFIWSDTESYQLFSEMQLD